MGVNKLILKQLEKVQVAKVSPFDELRNCYKISKFKEIAYELNHCYLIEINSVLLSASNIIASNWNNGSFPKHEFMKISVSKKLGDMIFIDGIYYDNALKQDINEMWTGWLPVNEIKLIEEL